jgi:hypothetical protein
MTRSTKRMLNALLEQNCSIQEQFRAAIQHDIKVTYRDILWFNNHTIKGINCGAVSLEFGAYNGQIR